MRSTNWGSMESCRASRNGVAAVECVALPSPPGNYRRLGDFEKSDFAVGRLVDATGPGKVLMVDVGGAPISTLGGLASLAASKRGATGVIIDGGCRDVEEIRATKLWLASRWVVPTTGKRRLKLQSLGGRYRSAEFRCRQAIWWSAMTRAS